jgi:hypothetical protein
LGKSGKGTNRRLLGNMRRARRLRPHSSGDRPGGPNLGDTDGIVELWFDDIDSFNAFGNSLSYLNVIRPDEERFTDPKKCE